MLETVAFDARALVIMHWKPLIDIADVVFGKRSGSSQSSASGLCIQTCS